MPSSYDGSTNKTVVASFYVNPDGRITNLKIVQKAGSEYDEEVLRVLRLMPKWKPRSNGRSFVGVNVTQPITFRPETKEF